MRINDRKRTGCAWQIIPWDRVPKMIGGSSEQSDSLCKFSEGFRAFSVMSAVISQYPDENLTPLRQKKLAGISIGV